MPCDQADSTACLHGTFVAGMLAANARCPSPRYLSQLHAPDSPHFCRSCVGPRTRAECDAGGTRRGDPGMYRRRSPRHQPEPRPCAPSVKGERSLEEALNHALKRGVVVAAAAGNQGTIGSSAITRHPWVMPVVACDIRGRPLNESNLGASIGRRGFRAPGDSITSLGAAGQSLTLSGTSVAVPFVTGATALLWSAFPSATAAQIKLAMSGPSGPRRPSVVPPLLDVAAAYGVLSEWTARRRMNGRRTPHERRPDAARTAATSGKAAWICHGRGHRPWRCRQTGDVLSGDTAVWRLRTSGGRAQSMDGFYSAIIRSNDTM